MPEIPDKNVPHESHVADAVDDQMARTSDHAAIADAVNVGTTFSQAEVNAVVGKVNEILDVLRDAGLIPSS